jgi:hypothetical protein
VLIAIAVCACAPAIDTAAERASAIDAGDAEHAAAVIRTAPYVIDARVALHRAFRDPLTGASSRGAAMVVVIVDARAQSAAIDAVARSAIRALMPDVTPQVVVTAAGQRDELARVGPFTVAASSKLPLTVVLVLLLAAVAALAGYVAWRDRPA